MSRSTTQAYGHLEVVLQNPAIDINRKIKKECIALIHAAAKVHADIVKQLLQHPDVEGTMSTAYNAARCVVQHKHLFCSV